MFYIYAIQNKINNKIWIGWTGNVKRRKREHFKFGYSKKSRHLYNAMKKYGINNFDFSIIETPETVEEAWEAEQFWIAFFNSSNDRFGYNKSLGGESGSYGTKHSEETKQIYREQRKGSKNPQSKLTEKDVGKIRLGYNNTSDPDFVKKIAKQYSVSLTPIYLALQGKSWKHIQTIKRTRKIIKSETLRKKISDARMGSKNPMSKLTENNVKDIREIYKNDPSV